MLNGTPNKKEYQVQDASKHVLTRASFYHPQLKEGWHIIQLRSSGPHAISYSHLGPGYTNMQCIQLCVDSHDLHTIGFQQANFGARWIQSDAWKRENYLHANYLVPVIYSIDPRDTILLYLLTFLAHAYVQTPMWALLLDHLLITALESFSWPSSPKFLMAPAFGASSRGFAASAFRYARCRARTLVAYHLVNKEVRKGWGGARELGCDQPPSCDVDIHSSLPVLECISACPSHLRRWYWLRSKLGLLAKTENNVIDLQNSNSEPLGTWIAIYCPG